MSETDQLPLVVESVGGVEGVWVDPGSLWCDAQHHGGSCWGGSDGKVGLDLITLA